MMNISDFPKYIQNKIFMFLENYEARLIKDFKSVINPKYPLFSYLKYNREYLPYETWLQRFDLYSLHSTYNPYTTKSISKPNLETYNNFEEFWEVIDDMSSDDDFDKDSI